MLSGRCAACKIHVEHDTVVVVGLDIVSDLTVLRCGEQESGESRRSPVCHATHKRQWKGYRSNWANDEKVKHISIAKVDA